MYFSEFVPNRGSALPPGLGQAPALAAGLSPVVDTTAAPFRWVCRVRVQGQTGHSFGSGILISPWHVLTAAHVIYSAQEPEGWRTIEVGPGYGRTSKATFPSNGWAVDPRWNVRNCMTDSSDLGLIRLARPVPPAIGFWKMMPFAPESIPGSSCFLAGYPATPDDGEATGMFHSEGRIIFGLRLKSCQPATRTRDGSGFADRLISITPATELIEHDCPSEHSMSGGPIWLVDERVFKLVAVHTGVVDKPSRKGVLLTERVQTQIRGWINGPMRPQ